MQDINHYTGFIAAAALFVFVPVLTTSGQVPDVAFEPYGYVAQRPSDSLEIDGRLDEESWQEAAWSENFMDIRGGDYPDPDYDTRVKMLWDEEYLYIGARLEEPHIWATLTQRDTVIFYDNDFEVFIDPDGDTHHYYELEINALGTVWDLMLTMPYRDGGRAIDAWDISGLRKGIQIEGTLNSPSDKDTAWTVELALPWNVLEEAASHGGPPDEGEQWRINFSRVQWHTEIREGRYRKKEDPETGEPLPEENWVWSPQGLINMHYPEMWGFLQFSTLPVDRDPPVFKIGKEEQIKWNLRKLYYQQREYREMHGQYAAEVENLDLSELPDHIRKQMKFARGFNSYEIMLPSLSGDGYWGINETGKIFFKETGN
ncbi:MAG: carbohydrate-binding family 9-like protein [Balneolaceae bacterium]